MSVAAVVLCAPAWRSLAPAEASSAFEHGEIACRELVVCPLLADDEIEAEPGGDDRRWRKPGGGIVVADTREVLRNEAVNDVAYLAQAATTELEHLVGRCLSEHVDSPRCHVNARLGLANPVTHLMRHREIAPALGSGVAAGCPGGRGR